jgi:hypothetical protein
MGSELGVTGGMDQIQSKTYATNECICWNVEHEHSEPPGKLHWYQILLGA